MQNFISIIRNPFFWASTSVFTGLVCIIVMKGEYRLGTNPILGFFTVFVFDLGRVIMVLPFCPQPRFNIDGWHWIIGGMIIVISLVFVIPSAAKIKPYSIPDEHIKLKTTGMYRITRNPIYFGEMFFFLGISIMFRSIIGLCFVPVWWIGMLILIKFEERALQDNLGEKYLEYKRKVRGRIIPGLPV